MHFFIIFYFYKKYDVHVKHSKAKMEVYYLFLICKFTHALKWVMNPHLALHTFLLRVEQMPFMVELIGSTLSIGYALFFFFF